MNNSLRATSILAVVAVAVAACGGATVERAQRLSTQGADAAAEAAREYRRLAFFEARIMDDQASALVYSEKALVAADGRLPEPIDPASRTLAQASRAEIEAAHARLRALIAAGATVRAPKAAGQALARYDCWVEQSEEGFQPLDIAFCRDGFLTYAAEAEHAVGGASKLPAGPELRAFTIPFPNGGREPGAGTDGIIRKAAEAAKDFGDVRVLVGGHTDRSGSSAANLALSEARAKSVRRALVARGVPADRIAVVGFGETYPKAVTADGVAAAENRRVDILIGRDRKL